MRYLILSDLHGNLEALRAVSASVRGEDFDATLLLGDLVGYGGAPNQVVDLVRGLGPGLHVIRGNHDKLVARIDNGSSFNSVARRAAEWTAGSLRPENLAYLRDLPPGPLEIEAGLWICHGSPLDEDAYVLSAFGAAQIFDHHEGGVTFFGHTHIASAFSLRDRGIEIDLPTGEDRSLALRPGVRYLLNPGSVGQPRDRDPRAAFMTYDSGERRARWRRVEYPVEAAQERILEAGLPKVLADRLALGV